MKAFLSQLSPAALLLAAALCGPSQAATYDFAFAGPDVSGSLALTYGTGTDATYPAAFQITGVSGTFTDTNSGLGIVNAPITSLVPISPVSPEQGNLLAPASFSRFAVASGLEHGVLSYSNLLYPAGSPQTATDYPFRGGVFDIYGLLFAIGDGRFVNLWSNGDMGGGIDYGVAVVTTAEALDYVGGVSAVPEPSSMMLLGGGLVALISWRRKVGPGRA